MLVPPSNKRGPAPSARQHGAWPLSGGAERLGCVRERRSVRLAVQGAPPTVEVTLAPLRTDTQLTVSRESPMVFLLQIPKNPLEFLQRLTQSWSTFLGCRYGLNQVHVWGLAQEIQVTL